MTNYRILALALVSPALVSAFVASRDSGSSRNPVSSSISKCLSLPPGCRNLSNYMATNPFASMIGDAASSIFGGSPKVVSNRKVEALLATTSTASWKELRENLESQQTPEENSFRQNLAKGYGVASPLHKIRLYDESNREEDIAVTFYRDSASWCVSLSILSFLTQVFVRVASPIKDL
jgi:hypothetical protein